MAWLNNWGIDENDILQNIDNVKNIITSKFKEKLWWEENLAIKRKQDTIRRSLILIWKIRSISR